MLLNGFYLWASLPRDLEQELDKRIYVAKPDLAQFYNRLAVHSRVLVCWNFRDDESFLQRLHRHFLFNCRYVLFKTERTNDIGANSPEPILTICEILFP